MIKFHGDIKALKNEIIFAKKVLKKISKDHKKSIFNIEYVFVDDNTLLEINRSSLGHDYYTDIITFDYSNSNKLEAEIYISIDRVKDNAIKFRQQFHVELLRVIVHGLLHILGYKDKSALEKKEMRKTEDYYLKNNV